ncbi:M48 family metalloprotease [Actinomadura parmotrematis]|uniref:M48 family metalloprotease n=1 Tax=Actinomadura parmotrematis TaxID=2864039 RepID=A0ABS7G722_9ACTN|nr:M48 family metalloprotease [Actinomadura parmotrematis]MBW8487659.1 M48 family metalloprotease [Actinomadura parmotrematis]
MSWLTFMPVALVTALGVLLGRTGLPLHPAWSARLLATVAAMAAVTTAGTLAFVAFDYGVALLPGAAARVPDRVLPDGGAVPHMLGVPAWTLSAVLVVACARLGARWAAQLRGARRASAGVLDTDDPIALAVPGRHGGVLVSRGLLAGLSGRELEVVFQHERAHLRHGHHRFLMAGMLAAAVSPVLRPLYARLELELERWADEDAAEAVADRTRVAHTIARVALARADRPEGLPAFAEAGVVQRVRALLAGPPAKNRVSGPVALTGGGLGTGVLAAAALELDRALAALSIL